MALGQPCMFCKAGLHVGFDTENPILYREFNATIAKWRKAGSPKGCACKACVPGFLGIYTCDGTPGDS